jgi:hypothetical protein
MAFIENESYKHKMAKVVLKQWFEQSEKNDYLSIGDIKFRPNRRSGVFLEYPICNNICSASVFDNSWECNWDEIRDNAWDEYVPTYNECVNLFQSYPIAIIDIVCPHKGRPYIGIEICHKNPVSLEKIDKLRKFGVDNLIEIDADWILNQTKIPSQLKYKRLI